MHKKSDHFNLLRLRNKLFSILGNNPLASQLLWTAYRSKHRQDFRQHSLDDPTLEEVREKGYSIIRDFYPRDACAAHAQEVERIFQKQSIVVHQPHGEQTDVRIFGIEALSNACRAFADDSRLLRLIDRYTDGAFMFTMANILATPNEYGSGGMWHRDGFLPELKCILYLTDVADENGPFRLISHSHATGRYHRRDMRRYGMRFLQNRLGDVADRVVANEPERLVTVAEPAGTLILFDTSLIHTGTPLQRGKRIALTNYYTQRGSISDSMRDYYAPVVIGENAYWKEGQVHQIA